MSEWVNRIAAAGFDGIELWENHALLAEAGEREALRRIALPIVVFNSYASMAAGAEGGREQAVRAIRQLNARAVKFNVSASAEALRDELKAAAEWSGAMPGVQLLCECHSGTAMEDPRQAAEALRDFPTIGIIVHPFMGENLTDWLAHAGSRVLHAHVQMCDAQDRRLRLREHPQLVHDRLCMLNDAGFDGTFTVEFTAGVGEAGEDRESLFTSACDDLDFLRTTAAQVLSR